MGKSLGFWMLYCVIVCLFAAYAGWYGLGHSATFAQVFRVVGAASLLGFAAGYMHDPIWKGGSWVTAFKFFFDGAVYALVTAATFGLLWPHA